jgi:hypothetical protein
MLRFTPAEREGHPGEFSGGTGEISRGKNLSFCT